MNEQEQTIKQKNEWMNEQTNKQTTKWTKEQTNKQINKLTKEQTNELINWLISVASSRVAFRPKKYGYVGGEISFHTQR